MKTFKRKNKKTRPLLIQIAGVFGIDIFGFIVVGDLLLIAPFVIDF